MVVLVIVVIITTVIGLISSDKLSEMKNYNDLDEMEGVAFTLKNEIDIAHSMSSGYIRTFELPENLLAGNYTIGLEEDSVVVRLNGKETVVSVQPVNGSVRKGENNITKMNGHVVLNG